jgi:hypothetical protein
VNARDESVLCHRHLRTVRRSTPRDFDILRQRLKPHCRRLSVMTKSSVGSVLLLLVTATAAQAQPAADPQVNAGVEITPYVSMASAAASGAGAAVRWPIGSSFSIEFDAGYRRSEIAAWYSNVNLLFDLPSIGRVTPYLATGIGLDQYGFAVTSPSGTVVTHSSTAVTINAGGGVRVPVNERWGVRADARWQNGFGSRAPERWKLFNGVSFRTGR